MIDEAFLTTDEVLEYLQVNLRTVYRLIKAGNIPAVRVGRQWRFRKSDIDAWLELERSHSVRPMRSSSTPAPADTPHGRPHVLVVDNEASIRDLHWLWPTMTSMWRQTGGSRLNGCDCSATTCSSRT
jgi:excisionase family DNA binding protein